MSYHFVCCFTGNILTPSVNNLYAVVLEIPRVRNCCLAICLKRGKTKKNSWQLIFKLTIKIISIDKNSSIHLMKLALLRIISNADFTSSLANPDVQKPRSFDLHFFSESPKIRVKSPPHYGSFRSG